jgi:signal transduction histidine kinase
VIIDFTVLKDDGNVVLRAAYCQDITDRKQLEQRVLETLKLESLGVLAGGLAHDFNNLLLSILGNAALVRDEQPPASPAHGKLAAIIRAGEQAAVLTSQMLAYSGKGSVIVRPVNLSTHIRELTKLLRGSVPADVRLEFDLTDDVPLVEADPSQIQQLILNLVVNSAEAIGEQKGVIRIRTGEATIPDNPAPGDFGPWDPQPGRYALLEVSDTGAGMDDDTVSRIFDPFFTTKFTGRGLGLAAVSGIVRSYGGAITVRSKLNEGSRFRVFLPASAREATTAAARHESKEIA